MHSFAIYKGYALYKIDGKITLQQQSSMWRPFAANVFAEFLLLLFRDMLLIFFIVCFLSMYTFLFFLCACLWESVLFIVYPHSVLTFYWTYVIFKVCHLCSTVLLYWDKKKSNS